MSAAAAVPLPWLTVQNWVYMRGWDFTVTAYALPAATRVANWRLPFALTARSSPALFCSTRPWPSRPLTVTFTVKACVAHTTITPVIAVSATVPVPALTVQTCEGPPGCDCTLTA